MGINPKNTKGKILPAGTMFLHEQIATVTGEDGTEYRICAQTPVRVPLVQSGKTGKWFQLGLEQIMAQALEAGIADAE